MRKGKWDAVQTLNQGSNKFKVTEMYHYNIGDNFIVSTAIKKASIEKNNS